jgi:AcrR family transcriptional regulator|tara:strand:+ start:685 stop:1332 length:648 start_codon:yes stop_codon:yes gene_type:complete
MATSAGDTAVKISRSERKRLETRAKIISAAIELLCSRPLDELTIAEITEAADVGHGTFYLHFKSKHDVMVPIFQEKAKHWDAKIHEGSEALDDPAAAVSRSTRFIARMILADTLCRRFLRDSGFPLGEVRDALGSFIARDIRLGVEAGRFQTQDLDLTARYLMGGAVACLMNVGDMPDPEAQIDSLAELMLCALGVPVQEAREISRGPLPELDIS